MFKAGGQSQKVRERAGNRSEALVETMIHHLDRLPWGWGCGRGDALRKLEALDLTQGLITGTALCFQDTEGGRQNTSTPSLYQ